MLSPALRKREVMARNTMGCGLLLIDAAARLAHFGTHMTATTIYLYVNAVLYAVFALWCTFGHERTAQSLGYLTRNNAGRSEYLTVYGGLQWGLAILFATLATHRAPETLALAISIGIYAPIVLYRLASLFRYAPVGGLTKSVAALETALLVAAVALWFAR